MDRIAVALLVMLGCVAIFWHQVVAAVCWLAHPIGALASLVLMLVIVLGPVVDVALFGRALVKLWGRKPKPE